MSDTKAAAAPAAAKTASPPALKGAGAPKKVAEPKKDAAKNVEGGKQKRVKKPRVKVDKDGKKLKPWQINQGRPRNYVLTAGLMAYSKSQIFHKKGKWKFVDKKSPKKVRPKKPFFVEKPIRGEKNGGTRKVLVKRRRKDYPVAEFIKKTGKSRSFIRARPHVRKSLKPGTICILLAGPHKGKRVVLIKSLRSGLLLVNGPYKLNGCPLRRVHPNFVIATSTRLDLSDAKFPPHLKDDYFRRARAKKTKKEEGDIFSTKKEKYTPSEQKKKDQKLADYLVLKSFDKFKDSTPLLYRYMSSSFSLKSSQYPHRMKF